jgi:hypothetical protein
MDLESKKTVAQVLIVAFSSLAAMMMADDNSAMKEEEAIVDAENILKRKRYDMEREEMRTMKNRYKYHESPRIPLMPKNVLGEMIADPGRNYMKDFTSFYVWEFLALAEHLRPLIFTAFSIR